MSIEINESGDRKWKNKEGRLHRENGPAVEWNNGDKIWFINGELHREDGPAIERSDGIKKWWINGTKYTKEEYLKYINKSVK